MVLGMIRPEDNCFVCDECGDVAGSVYVDGYNLDLGHGDFEEVRELICERCWRRRNPEARLPGEPVDVIC